MTRRDPHLRIVHMLDHAREAAEMAEGRSREDLDEDRQLELSLVRLLEIVGEAANRVPDVERARYPGVPWQDIVDLRHRLIHGYDSVDLDVLWQIIQVDLPELIKALGKLSGERGRASDEDESSAAEGDERSI